MPTQQELLLELDKAVETEDMTAIRKIKNLLKQIPAKPAKGWVNTFIDSRTEHMDESVKNLSPKAAKKKGLGLVINTGQRPADEVRDVTCGICGKKYQFSNSYIAANTHLGDEDRPAHFKCNRCATKRR